MTHEGSEEASTDGSVREDTQNPPGAVRFVLALLAVIAIQIIYGIVVFLTIGPEMDKRGQFGDIFGGVNALFTGSAFAGVIYTILLQRRELELQRDELRLTNEELHVSAKAQQEQVAQLKDAANLSALATLLNVYSTDLQPLRAITQAPREELASRRALQRQEGLTTRQRSQFNDDIRALEKQITDQEAEWDVLLRKQDTQVRRLEKLVERADRYSPTSADQ